ncbi:MAG TPA: hypothetical protein ENI62_14890 [Gammaproteobacteria bacterium]|nr:hypothetical protein [Gammaproteobacteria bacterium]
MSYRYCHDKICRLLYLQGPSVIPSQRFVSKQSGLQSRITHHLNLRDHVNQNNQEISATPAAATSKKLYLYHYDGCLFCWRVKRVINKLGIDVELRDIWESNDYRQQLVKACGRQTVPVLLEVTADGREQWIPESRDIIKHLNKIQQPH